LSHTAGVNSAVFSSNDARILTASDDNTARIWDAVSGREIVSFFHAGTRVSRDNGFSFKAGLVRAAIFSPDSTRVITGAYDGTGRIWQVPAAALSDRTILEHDACALALAGQFSALTDSELADLPFLDPVLGRDPCNPPSFWSRAAYALGIEDGMLNHAANGSR